MKVSFLDFSQKRITRSNHQLKKTFFLGLLCVLPIAAEAQSFFDKPTEFKLLKSCKAYSSTHKKTGKVNLTVGKHYKALGENSTSNPSHVYIEVNGQKKWLDLTCGQYCNSSDDCPLPTSKTITPTPTSSCLPFFDDQDNPVKIKASGTVDITPQAPAIDAFGTAVNNMCGASGKKTTRDEFKTLMQNNPAVLTDLMNYTGNKVFSTDSVLNKDDYLEKLTDAWYAVQAFDHIFCGEPTDSKVDGLHYQGRYQQLQASGEACRLPPNPKNEVIPGSVYSMGAKMKNASGKWVESPIKGYGLTLSASDMLKTATRAFQENPTSSTSSTACMLKVKDTSDGVDYDIVFVRRSAGIRTFYPDATPDSSPLCANKLNLP